MGTGEITRYIGMYGTKRLRKAVLIGTLGPYLLRAPDNPEGIDASVFKGIQAGIKADRPVAVLEFLKNFYSVGGPDGKLVSERVIQANWTVAIGASPIATVALCRRLDRRFPQGHLPQRFADHDHSWR
jgi:non-heme chloroperoxidase